jgi:general secretion pathway protein A
MYQAFYGLREIPFSIAPNPKYLYLSERHQEALVHLKYCLNSGGGFVLLTGEVGTGKTTLARTLLRDLTTDTDIASILNPSLTELELLATLCDELAITYPTEPTLKQLVDVISRFLINNHDSGRKTLLVIDEAQHLRSEVLEQLRLLTNLETDSDKLLQVMLIGQPELQQQLKQQHLRQLAQRITARYHLLPLEQGEVSAYIAHRLAVAGRQHVLFSKKSCDRIFVLSDGIPRVINLICDKALLLAYGEQLTEIGLDNVNQAASQVLFVDYQAPGPSSSAGWLKPTLASGAFLMFGFGLFWAGQAFNRSQPVDVPNAVAITAPVLVPEPLIVPEVTVVSKTPVVVIGSLSQQLQPYLAKSRLKQTAFSGLMGLWGTAQGAGSDPCFSAKQYGLRCLEGSGWNQLIEYNHPAVVALNVDGQNYHGVVVAFDGGDEVLLQLFDRQLVVTKSWLLQRWAGSFTLLWQPPTGFNKYLKLGDRGLAVGALASMLNQQYQLSNTSLDGFDRVLALLVRRFQGDNQLTVDGIVGIKTLFKLQIATAQQGQSLIKTSPLMMVDNASWQPTTSSATLAIQTVALPPAPVEAIRYQATLSKRRPNIVSGNIQLPAAKPIKPQALKLEPLAVQGGVSADLAQRFSQALAAMEAEQGAEAKPAKLHPQALVNFPQWYQELVPPLSFSSHIYSSEQAERWVKVNRQIVKEGELITADLRLVMVTPEQVVIEMQQRQFTLPALTDW